MYATLKKAQPYALRILENSIKNNRLSHAYLFTGPNGTYKKEMAYHLAMMLYCKEDTPCYNCENCKAILENRHLNIYYVEPFGQNIKKEQIMALQEEFSKTSLLPGPRIYIINEADKMNSSAANSLLKFIEEPSGDIYGILITEHKENILPTIVSRSMVVSFSQLDKNLLKEQLQPLCNDELLLNAVCHLTSNLDEAKSLLEDEGFVKIVSVFEDFVKKMANQENTNLFYRENADILGIKDRLKTFLLLLECYFRDIYEYQITNNVLVFDSLLENIKLTSNYYATDDVMKYLFMVLELSKKVGYNVNMSLFINQFLIELNGGI